MIHQHEKNRKKQKRKKKEPAVNTMQYQEQRDGGLRSQGHNKLSQHERQIDCARGEGETTAWDLTRIGAAIRRTLLVLDVNFSLTATFLLRLL